jgi:hypothetical protein
VDGSRPTPMQYERCDPIVDLRQNGRRNDPLENVLESPLTMKLDALENWPIHGNGPGCKKKWEALRRGRPIEDGKKTNRLYVE